MRDPSGTHFGLLKVLFEDCSHTPTTDVQYSRQLADSYSPVLPDGCINAITVLACEVLGRRSWGSLSTFFKRTAPLTDTNIWQCPLTILPLQPWTDLRRFTTFYRQEFDYNALFHAHMYLRFPRLPHNWQNCAVANTRSVNYLASVLPPSTYYYFQSTTLHFWTTKKS
jgi:hypothetical protein